MPASFTEHQKPASRRGGQNAGAAAQRRSPFHLLITSAMTATVLFGFSFTYFGPLARGAYPEVSPLVHIHGWTFFAWYVLLPLQAGLIRFRRVSAHRNLGLASAFLGATMVAVGLLVSLVQIQRARGPDGDPFWQLMGIPIFAAWVLFTACYVEAMRRRRRVAEHKRLIILASAVALSAATFRIVVKVAGFSTTTAIVGMLSAMLFPLAAMVHDYRKQRIVHPVYAWGVPILTLIICGAFIVAHIPAGEALGRVLGGLGHRLEPLYVAR